jgi:hypothetical protein
VVFLRLFKRMFEIGYFRSFYVFINSVGLLEIRSEVRHDFPQPLHTNYLSGHHSIHENTVLSVDGNLCNRCN